MEKGLVAAQALSRTRKKAEPWRVPVPDFETVVMTPPAACP